MSDRFNKDDWKTFTIIMLIPSVVVGVFYILVRLLIWIGIL